MKEYSQFPIRAAETVDTQEELFRKYPELGFEFDDQLMAPGVRGSASLELIIGLEMLIQNGSLTVETATKRGIQQSRKRERGVRMKRTQN